MQQCKIYGLWCLHLRLPKGRLLVPLVVVISRQPPHPGHGRHQETLTMTSSLGPFHNPGYMSLEKVLTLCFLLHKMKIILLISISVLWLPRQNTQTLWLRMTELYHRTVQEAGWGSEIQDSAGLCCLWNLEGKDPSCFFWTQMFPDCSSQSPHGLLPVTLHTVLPCVQMSPSYEDTSHAGLEPSLMTPFKVTCLCKDPISV